MLRIDIVSLFPEFVAQVASHGVVGRARERGLLSLHGWNPRDHAQGGSRVASTTVRSAAGRHGDADRIRCALALAAARAGDPNPVKVVYLSPQGARMNQGKARELAYRERLLLRVWPLRRHR